MTQHRPRRFERLALRRVRAEEVPIRRFVEECWLAYQSELTDSVTAHSLVDDLDRSAVVEHYCDLLDSPSDRLWVALEETTVPATTLASTEAAITGFVRTSLCPAPQEFDWPDRLAIEDLWVRDAARGSGLADALLRRAVQQAREAGCEALTLDVSLDNKRAIRYFEHLGFEVHGYRMHVPVDDLTLDRSASISGESASPILRRLRVDDAAMDRFVEECWLPFWRDLGEAVGESHLSPDLDRDALVAELLDSYDVPDRRCWVALEGTGDQTTGLANTDAVFAGWINAGLEPTDRFLDPPERLFVGNLYVGEAYRGEGLADSLVARALQYAREEGCVELSLGTEVDNDRALAYYEKLGFEPLRQGMSGQLDSLDL